MGRRLGSGDQGKLAERSGGTDVLTVKPAVDRDRPEGTKSLIMRNLRAGNETLKRASAAGVDEFSHNEKTSDRGSDVVVRAVFVDAKNLDAVDFVDRIEGKQVELIDGDQLATLKIEHGLCNRA